MSYFVTKSNLFSLMNRLDRDIPTIALQDYYKNTILTDFALKADIFSLKEAKALSIAQDLFKEIARINQDFFITEAKKESKNWVYEIAAPAYHLNRDCELLTSDFVNYPIPVSCDQGDEYRDYFIENKGKYGNSENKREPMIFARRLKEKFNLTEDLKELLENYITPYLRNNSGVINSTYKLSSGDILEHIAELRALMEDKHMSSAEVARSGVLKNRSDLSEKKRQDCNDAYQLRKTIFYSLMHYYLYSLLEDGLDASKEFMEILGFRCCKRCEDKNRLAQLKERFGMY